MIRPSSPNIPAESKKNIDFPLDYSFQEDTLRNHKVLWFGEHLRSEWNKIWVREQQVCSWLARHNVVVFIERMNSSTLDFKRIAKGLLKRIKSRVQSSPKLDSKNTSTACLRFVQPIFIPFSPKFDRVNVALLGHQIGRLFGGIDPNQFLVWIAHPSKYALLAMQNLPDPKMIIYQCVDRYVSGLGYDNETIEIDNRITRMADLVITPSKTITEDKYNLNKNTHRIPHGAPDEAIQFARTQAKVAPVLSSSDSPFKIGYFGSFHHIFDFELVRIAAETFHDAEFILWGPVNTFARIAFRGIPNIRLAGFLPAVDAPARLSEYDVCIIPYLKNDFSLAVFPHKLFSYLATGRPVVATRLPDLEDFDDWVELADDRASFLTCLAHSLHKSRAPDYLRSRIAGVCELLSQHSLESTFDQLDELLK